MQSWSPQTYARFEAERRRPCQDLLARVPTGERRRITDLGCGNGVSTEALAERYPGAELTGVDTSPEMLAAARTRLPGFRFVEGDAATWRDGPADLIFANALMQWVPDHIAVITRLVGDLAPGGCLAVQMPDNDLEPTHVLMREIAAEAPFSTLLAAAGRGRSPIGSFADYEAALAPLCDHIDIWRTVYVHRLERPDAIVGFVEGAGLRPYLTPLGPEAREAFLARYREGVAKAYPLTASGGVLLPFPRLFVVASRAGADVGDG